MASSSTRKDHQAIAFFRVEIDSIESAAFRKCGGLKSESEVFEYQEGGDNETVRKLIGPSKAANLVLTKGYVMDPALFKWRDEIAASGTKKIARRNGSIVALAPDGKTELGRWNFQKAWPVRWEMTEFDASTGQAMCELLELAVEKITKG
ncbi:MAG: phage tail protein [Myxococcales bacterium]